MRNVRAMDAPRLNVLGPVMESRPALPNSPGSGRMYASGLRNIPGAAAYKGWPVYSGRISPCEAVPPSTQREQAGERGNPDPMLTLVVIVQSFTKAPRHPPSRVP